jgi:ABC-2 type transport system permease protein
VASFRRIWIICKRELYAYFASPIAWVLLAIFAFLGGWVTTSQAQNLARASIESQMQGQNFPMNLNQYGIAPVLSTMAVIAVFLVPIISMRLFAEEKRQGTIELLVTSPVHDLEIILGKWLAAVLMYTALLVVLIVDLSFFFFYGTPSWKPFLTGLLGLVLQGACLMALGAFISSLTKNQIVAGSVGFGAALILWLLSWATAYGNADWAQVLSYLSIVSHVDTFTRGVIDTKDLVYYCSMIFLGLFLTSRSLESIRWRG